MKSCSPSWLTFQAPRAGGTNAPLTASPLPLKAGVSVIPIALICTVHALSASIARMTGSAPTMGREPLWRPIVLIRSSVSSPRYTSTIKFDDPLCVKDATEIDEGSINSSVTYCPVPDSTIGSGSGVGVAVSVGTGVSAGIGVSVGTGVSVGMGVSEGAGGSVGCSASVTSTGCVVWTTADDVGKASSPGGATSAAKMATTTHTATIAPTISSHPRLFFGFSTGVEVADVPRVGSSCAPQLLQNLLVGGFSAPQEGHTSACLGNLLSQSQSVKQDAVMWGSACRYYTRGTERSQPNRCDLATTSAESAFIATNELLAPSVPR